MKKSFNSGKLLTLLSSLIFAMSCGYLVYAAGGFDNWKVPDGIGYELDKSEWNSLMDSIGIPKGAVMAFNLTSCPTGWKDYTAAEGRFIMGANSTYRFNRYGDGKVTLQVANLPAHKHSLKMVVDGADVSDDIYMTSGIGNIPRQYEYDDDGGYAFVSTEENFYGDKWFDDDYTSYNNWKSTQYSSRTMKSEPFLVLPPYVALKYCEKK